MMLKIENLHVYYDAIHAIKGVTLNVQEGEIVSLIGANGAARLQSSALFRDSNGLKKVVLNLWAAS